MSLLPRLCLILALAGGVAACQVNTPASDGNGLTANAVTGDAIEVTALEPPPAAAVSATGDGASSAVPPAPGPETAPVAAPDTAANAAPDSGVAADTGASGPATDPAPTEAAAAADEAAPADPGTAAAEPPPPPKSERQIACERKRGTWEDTGGGLMICIRATRDGGKRCTRESQCEGLCLARSGTCAPVDPVLGCHDILQDDGSRATQCIE